MDRYYNLAAVITSGLHAGTKFRRATAALPRQPRQAYTVSTDALDYVLYSQCLFTCIGPIGLTNLIYLQLVSSAFNYQVL